VDGLELPENKPAQWQIGGTATVGFAITANHGGGYSWRLCKKDGNVTEECFRQNTLRFHGNHSWLHYAEAIPSFMQFGPFGNSKINIPRVVVPGDQVHPKGSHWARNPIPGCKSCDQTKCGGLLPNMTDQIDSKLVSNGGPYGGGPFYGGNAWWKQEQCAQECSNCGMLQFEEPAPGYGKFSGYVGNYNVSEGSEPQAFIIEGFWFSVMDKVEVPKHLDEGEYLLSWRWDCEQSPQIWQQCADIRLVKESAEVFV
jgi:hypothetical protein